MNNLRELINVCLILLGLMTIAIVAKTCAGMSRSTQTEQDAHSHEKHHHEQGREHIDDPIVKIIREKEGFKNNREVPQQHHDDIGDKYDR